MNITITKTISNKIDVQIPIPSFWKQDDSRNYLAILDEKTVAKIFISYDGKYVSLANSDISWFGRELSEAATSWLLCPESEFMQAYDDAWESIRLKPVLIDTGSENGYAEFMKTQNF